MRLKRKSFTKIAIIIYVCIFIIGYFIFLIFRYFGSKPLFNNIFPIFILIGFSILIILIFYIFINLHKFVSNSSFEAKSFEFKFLNENFFKFVIIILMSIAIIIPPVSFSKLIISWNEISLYNYFRIIIFLIGAAYLPGSCLFNLFFGEKEIFQNSKLEQILLKITIYPLLSFTFLAFITLILDRLGLIREFFSICLFLIIVFIFACDLIVNVFKRKTNSLIEIKKAKFSKFSILILLIALAIILISLNIALSSKYNIPGDNWRAISYVQYVGDSKFDTFNKYGEYWGYFSFSLSILTGIPAINLNALLFPFLYLSITSIYLFIRAILPNFKRIYSLLASIFIITFSELFFITNANLNPDAVSWLIFDLILVFRYKSFSLYLLFTSLSLFIITINKFEINKETIKEKRYKTKENIGLIILGAWFLVNSFILYLIPLIFGLLIIFIYFLLSKKKEISFFFVSIFLSSLIILFIIFDLLVCFNFSYILVFNIFYFDFGIPLVFTEVILSLNAIIVYLFLTICFLIFSFFSKIYIHFNLNRFKKHYRKNYYIVFILFFGIFTILLGVEIIIIILGVFEKNFFLYYLDIIFINIGFIGIVGIYLSYITFKVNRKIFYTLIIWLFTSFFLASSLIFLNWISYSYTSPINIPGRAFALMTYWFDRLRYYSFFPLSIFASIGFIELIKKMYLRKTIKFKNIKLILKPILPSIIIFLSFSNTIISGINWNSQTWYVRDNEAQMMGWASENLPKNSKILIDSHNMKYLRQITTFSTLFIWEEINNLFDKLRLDIDYESDNHCNLSILDDYNGEKNVLKLEDNNQTGRISMLFNFNIIPQYGNVEFLMKTTNSSKSSFITLNNDTITIEIRENGLYYHNNTNTIKITNIENDYWYKIKIYFTTTNNTYGNLNQFQWIIIINGTGYGHYDFRKKDAEINYLKFYTSSEDSNWTTFFNNINFSWISGIIDIKKYIFKHLLIIDNLKSRNITYYIHFDDVNVNSKIKEKIDVEKEIIEGFYNNLLYRYKNISLYAST